MLDINPDTVRFIIEKAHEFQMLEERDESESIEDRDPAFAELKATIEDLEPKSAWSGSCGLAAATIRSTSGTRR